jgi:hypothetical protein
MARGKVWCVSDADLHSKVEQMHRISYRQVSHRIVLYGIGLPARGATLFSQIGDSASSPGAVPEYAAVPRVWSSTPSALLPSSTSQGPLVFPEIRRSGGEPG